MVLALCQQVNVNIMQTKGEGGENARIDYNSEKRAACIIPGSGRGNKADGGEPEFIYQALDQRGQ